MNKKERIIKEYWKDKKQEIFMGININLGCGNNPQDGYINYDKYPIDDRVKYIDLNVLPLPFKDNSVDEILLSHVLEHLFYPYEVIMECYRILKKGGVLYVNLPTTMRASLCHRSVGHGKDYFYSVSHSGRGGETGNYFNISVVPGSHHYKGLEYFYHRWLNFRDWIYRQFVDEWQYTLVKK